MMLTSGQRVLIAGVIADDGIDFARACVLADKVADALNNLEKRGGEDRDGLEFAHGFNEMDRFG